MPGVPTRLVPPWELLYDAVALGMWAYTSAAFRVRVLFPRGLRLERGVLYVATHRAETDVPLICGHAYFATRMWRERRQPRLCFAARDDLFEKGFFAGFPPGLSLGARRLLYPICAGPYLPRVRVNPLPYPGSETLRLGRALAELAPDTPLEEVVPPRALAGLRQRAAEAGLPPPQTAGGVLRGEYADLLWQAFGRDELDSPLLSEVWRRRAEQAAEDVRNLIELVRSGAPTLFFPEGRPSPDGAVGPLRAGMRLLVRRGKPRALRVVGIAYDRLTRGSPYAYLALGPPLEPPRDGVDEVVLAAMRRTLPLTCGQAIAGELLAAVAEGRERLAASSLDAAFAREAAAAQAQGRPLDAAFLGPEGRRERLEEALRSLIRRGLARAEGRRHLVLDTVQVAEDKELRYLARELEDARRAAPGPV